jgi:hypothetical protein
MDDEEAPVVEDASARRARLKALRAAAGCGETASGAAAPAPPASLTPDAKPSGLINPLADDGDGDGDGGGGKGGKGSKTAPKYSFYSDPMVQYEDPQVSGRVIPAVKPKSGGGAPGLMPGMGGGVQTMQAPRQLRPAPAFVAGPAPPRGGPPPPPQHWMGMGGGAPPFHAYPPPPGRAGHGILTLARSLCTRTRSTSSPPPPPWPHTASSPLARCVPVLVVHPRHCLLPPPWPHTASPFRLNCQPSQL